MRDRASDPPEADDRDREILKRTQFPHHRGVPRAFELAAMHRRQPADERQEEHHRVLGDDRREGIADVGNDRPGGDAEAKQRIVTDARQPDPAQRGCTFLEDLGNRGVVRRRYRPQRLHARRFSFERREIVGTDEFEVQALCQPDQLVTEDVRPQDYLERRWSRHARSFVARSSTASLDDRNASRWERRSSTDSEGSMLQQRQREADHDRASDVLAVHSLDHFALSVPDLTKAQEFYELFGLRTAERGAGLELRTLDGLAGYLYEGPRRTLHQ